MARRTSRARRSPPTRWLFRWPRGIFLRFLVVLISLALFGLIVSIYAYTQLSQMITLGVEGKRWSLSSKVYAEPVSLYPGLSLRIDDLHVGAHERCPARVTEVFIEGTEPRRLCPLH